MSSFYSRCLWCNMDLPRGLSFCTPTHREWWNRHHQNQEPTPVTLTDEWPLVERERSEVAVSAGNRQDASPGTGERSGEGITSPTARSLYYDHKRVFPF